MIHCEKCKSSGHIVAVHKTTKMLFTFKCTCEIPARRKLSKEYIEWHEKYRKDYDVEFDGLYQPVKPPLDL